TLFRSDKKDDFMNGKYNPLNTGVWNFDRMAETLIKEIKSVDSAELDKIMDVETQLPGYWSE
ncbi:MAG: hypothetical protein PQJ58_14800, partial [Spirochaetales bacterium]|nr:hypothetical protein [Spirochaetales bacterium]